MNTKLEMVLPAARLSEYPQLPRFGLRSRHRQRLYRPGAARANATIAFRRLLAALVFAALSQTTLAQTAPKCGDHPEIYSVAAPTAHPQKKQAGGPPAAYLNDAISIGVCKLDMLEAAATAGQKDITLFINGVDAGLKASGIDRDRQAMTFNLSRTPQNKELWKPLLSNPFGDAGEPLRLSVGLAGGQPLPKMADANAELRFNKLWVDGWTYATAALLVIVLALTAYFGKNSDMLRDAPAADGVRQTYSLARVQMVWWFVLVVAGFLAILVVTGDLDTIPATIVALTGISATTGVAAALITPRSSQRAAALKAQLTELCDGLDAAIVDINTAIAAVDLQVAAAQSAALPTGTLTELKQGLQARKEVRQRDRDHVTLSLTGISPVTPSAGFWKDLATDDRGAVALDRLQMVVWTILLGGLFLHSVLVYVTMPDFSTTLLALMGVSSGTYIGFKMPQART